MAGVAAIKQSRWPLDVLVASGWLLTVASIGILFERQSRVVEPWIWQGRNDVDPYRRNLLARRRT